MRSENFNRYRATQAGIQRTVHFPHSAGAKRRLDFVGTEFRARSEGHRCRVIIISSKNIEADPTTLDGLSATRNYPPEARRALTIKSRGHMRRCNRHRFASKRALA